MGVKVKFWKGAWWVFVNHHGKRKAKRIGDKETAQRVAKAIRERLARGDFNLAPPADVQTLRVYAESWLKTASGSLKASTVTFYRAHLTAHILPLLGDRPVTSVIRQDCRELVTTCRGKGLSRGSVRGIVRTLSTILSQAVEDDLLEANPALRMGRYLRAGDEPKKTIDPLTRAEAATLLAVSRERYARWFPLLLCALRSGLRQGELLGLRWADVDFASGFLHVRQNRVHGVTTTPKNHQVRKVDMSAQLCLELEALRRRERARWLADGAEHPSMVFSSDTGGFLDVGNVRRAFYRILTGAGLRHIRFHDLRHTFASLLIQQGESLAYIRDQMGHASIQITVDTYGHLVPGGNRAAVDRLDDEAQPAATPAQPEGVSGGAEWLQVVGGPPGDRTRDTLIKSQVLYH
jgi:integrase